MRAEVMVSQISARTKTKSNVLQHELEVNLALLTGGVSLKTVESIEFGVGVKGSEQERGEGKIVEDVLITGVQFDSLLHISLRENHCASATFHPH